MLTDRCTVCASGCCWRLKAAHAKTTEGQLDVEDTLAITTSAVISSKDNFRNGVGCPARTYESDLIAIQVTGFCWFKTKTWVWSDEEGQFGFGMIHALPVSFYLYAKVSLMYI